MVWIQNAVCFIFSIIIICSACFGELYSLVATPSLLEDAEKLFDGNSINLPDNVETIEMPNTVQLNVKTAWQLLQCISLFTDAIHSSTNENTTEEAIEEIMGDFTGNSVENPLEKPKKEPNVLDQQDINAIANSALLFTALVNGNILTNTLCFIMIPICQIALVVAGLGCIIDPLIKRKKTGAEINQELIGNIGHAFGVLPFLILVKILNPTMIMGDGIKLILATFFIAIAAFFVTSRLKSYLKSETEYLNIMQFLSVIGIVGAILFVQNLEKSNFLALLSDQFIMVSGTSFLQMLFANALDAKAIIFMCASILIFISTLGILKCVKQLLVHMACVVPKDEKISLGWLYALLMIGSLMVIKYYLKVDINNSNLTLSIIGILIVVAAENVINHLENTKYQNEKKVIYCKVNFQNNTAKQSEQESKEKAN